MHKKFATHSKVRTRPRQERRVEQIRPHHRPGRGIATAHRDRRLKIQPEIAAALEILVVLDDRESGLPRIQHILHHLAAPDRARRPIDRRRTREPTRLAVRVWISRSDERGQVRFVRFCESGESGEYDGEYGSQSVVFKVGVPEGREEIGGMPAGEGCVLHVIGLAGEGGG